jgi:phage terminase small subunit
LTEQQKTFADQYLIDLNATQAAIRAGYASISARSQASVFLTNPEISKYIKDKRTEISANTQLDIEWALNRYKDISDRCMQAEPVMIFDGEQWVESGEYKFDGMAAKAATDSIVKILGGFEKDNSQKAIIIEAASVTIKRERDGA